MWHGHFNCERMTDKEVYIIDSAVTNPIFAVKISQQFGNKIIIL